jgi:hypothetical protein
MHFVQLSAGEHFDNFRALAILVMYGNIEFAAEIWHGVRSHSASAHASAVWETSCWTR